MMEVKPFNREMIEAFLKSNDLPYDVDEDGDISFGFSGDEKTGCAMRIWLMVAGENKDVYDLRIYADRTFPKEEWSKAVMACNEWNDAKRWPKAYFHVSDPDTEGQVDCEGDIDLEAGIHQELFDDFSLTIITRAQAFWEWMHSEKGF
ncbi:MAG: YbjN domain-containing protein [Candidatus Parcubacteria bacterium]|nr:YbjN domain-containing protein [Candidatus Parcubacteria bacterium]